MLRAIEDKVIVKPYKQEDKTSSSGLILSTLQDEMPNEGTVVAVGPGLLLDNGVLMKPDVQVGDSVVFSKYQGTKVEHDGDELIILTYRDIYAIVTK